MSQHRSCFRRPRRPRRGLVAMMLLMLSLITAPGCMQKPAFIEPDQRKPIDRRLVDYPGGVVLEEVVRNLTGPIDCDIDENGTIIVAESGADGRDPRIIGYRTDGTSFNIYPVNRTFIFPFDIIKVGFRIYGRVGGICAANGKVYVSHRDRDGLGVITAFDYDGNHTTVVANLPARGDNGLSDLVLRPNGRLWFGVGSATNSGVVGLDNWHWVKKYPDFSDRSFVDLKLNGYHFKSKNPDAGLFGGPEIAVTAPFQPFNVSSRTRIRADEFPTAAIYSVDASGGGLRVEAHGVRAPRGMALTGLGSLYMTVRGMELRGTRPIKDDPDAMLRVTQSAWYGFPDFSTDLVPITDERFQAPREMLIRSGYDEISFLIDRQASNQGQGLIEPARGTLLMTTFPSLSGAERFDFVPDRGPLREFRGQAIVPLSGDRHPFATSGRKLVNRVGFKVVRVDTSSREVAVVDFIRNAKDLPASLLDRGEGLIERPVAAKFAPDGSLYIVDFGPLEMKDGREKVRPNGGRILRLRAMDGVRSATTDTTTTTTAPTSE